MRRFRVVLMLLALVLCALPVLADTQMTITGVGGYNSGGVYTYPYYFTVGGTANVPLMCDTFQNEIAVGDSWKAIVNPITSGGTSGMFAGITNGYGGNSSSALYNAAGLIYLGALGQGPLGSYTTGGVSITNLSVGLANWAVWNLFDPNAVGDPNLVAAQALDNYALGVLNPTSYLGSVIIYTPDPAVIGSSPQEFIGVPEPGLAGLLGFGLTSLWAFRRKLAL